MLRSVSHQALLGGTFVLSLCLLSVTSVRALEVNPEPVSAPLPGANSSPQKTVASNQLVISKLNPKQGDVVKVKVTGPIVEGKGASITFNNQNIPLFKDTGAGSWSCLIGIPVTIDPGKYMVSFGDCKKNINVLNAKFPTRNLRLPKKKNNFKASPGEKETIKKAKKFLSAEKLWTGKFKRPVNKARISSVFGIRRRVNGKLLKDYFHSGTDFAAPRGTAIYACEAGKVIVAKKGWRLHGNTVCIDHGRGVISIYIHMNSLNVKEGQTVAKGQKIGAVGSTGRASGPHLHFGVYVNNVATNPMSWFANVF